MQRDPIQCTHFLDIDTAVLDCFRNAFSGTYAVGNALYTE